jgi:RND superfamily putative drug exporter
MSLLGKWNWWIPKWLERRLPRLDVEPVAPAGAEGRA